LEGIVTWCCQFCKKQECTENIWVFVVQFMGHILVFALVCTTSNGVTDDSSTLHCKKWNTSVCNIKMTIYWKYGTVTTNTAVLWPNGVRLLIYWFDSMFRPLQLGHHQVYKMFHTCSSFTTTVLWCTF
jgi:hypothetical protein